MSDDAARYAYRGLDRVIHEKARLGILSSLCAHPDGLGFLDLKRLCSLTDGNLSRHVKVLQEAGLIGIAKTHQGAKPHTHCAVTKEGRERFLAYVAILEQVVRDAAESEAEAPPAGSALGRV